MIDEPRDRSFTQALEAQRERERGHSTDPNWRPDDGGLPEPHDALLGVGCCPCSECGRKRRSYLGWTSPTAGTIALPTVEPLSPCRRAELERILLDIDVARERLAKLLDRS